MPGFQRVRITFIFRNQLATLGRKVSPSQGGPDLSSGGSRRRWSYGVNNQHFPPYPAVATRRSPGHVTYRVIVTPAKLHKRVIVTPAVYPRFIEFLHFDIQSTGQKSHRVNTRRGPSRCFVLIKQSDSPGPHQFWCAGEAARIADPGPIWAPRTPPAN